MAMGGTFETHNKILPGAYINFISKTRPMGTIGDRGVCAIALNHGWGNSEEIIDITLEELQTNSLELLGYPWVSNELLPFREILKHARLIKFYNLGTNIKASATMTGLTVTAKYGGIRGNDISVSISDDIDTNGKIVKTILDNNEIDLQLVTSISDLINNAFVDFSGTGTLTTTANTKLTGGANGVINGTEYQTFLNVIEGVTFNTLAYLGDDDTTKGLFDSFTKRLRDSEGIKIQCVLINYSKADFEGVISVNDKCKELGYWVLGAIAGKPINESLTNVIYDGEIKLRLNFKKSELEDAIKNGTFIFYGDMDNIRVLSEINTFISVSSNKNKDFSNNQVIRILDNIGNDIARIFNDSYLGKEQNDDTGRLLFRSEILTYLKNLESLRAVENVNVEDIQILKGIQKGDVISTVKIKVVAAMDKLYMKCIIE